MPGSVLAIATSDNAPGGAILTFAFPIILFAIIGTVLYILLFSRPHPRVPAGHVALAGANRLRHGSPSPRSPADSPSGAIPNRVQRVNYPELCNGYVWPSNGSGFGRAS